MIPLPSHGWFEVIRERSGSGGSVVDSRAESVRDRAVGERTKSAIVSQYVTSIIDSNHNGMTTYLDSRVH